jgi:hypothetical protein
VTRTTATTTMQNTLPSGPTFFDERGRKLDKKALVAAIAPLPPGSSGTINLENVQSQIERGVAAVFAGVAIAQGTAAPKTNDHAATFDRRYGEVAGSDWSALVIEDC